MVYGLNVELQATCSALGYIDKGVYYKETDCIESVKDLIRFLKREDDTCDIRQQLGEAQILQNDLIPLVKQYKDDRDLLDTVLRLMVNLSQPAILCFKNHVPEDKTTRNHYLQIETFLQAYKEAFADEGLFNVLTTKLGALLQLDWEHRHEDDRLLIERILILVRNILHVPPNPTGEQRTDDDASIHDQVLWALHTSGMEDLLLYVASSEDERQFSFHVLEIISLMFREQTPEQVATAGGPRSHSERDADERDLAMALEQERAVKKAKVFKYSSRHSRFGGTFTMSNVKSISSNDMIYHRAVNQARDLSFDHNKKQKKTPKNRRAVSEREEDQTRRSTLSIRCFLKQFCAQFLHNCYNPLMNSVKSILVRSGAQDNDETYYLWAMRFFMEFNRKLHKHIRIDLVGETISVTAFHYIQTNLQTYFEMFLSNKKEGKLWSRRMHLALKAYFELLHTLHAMDQSADSDTRESAKVISGNVFYMMEYRDIFLLLLKKFDESKQSRGLLKDLVEATHLYTKMLEGYSKMHSHLVVQKKVKKTKRKKKAAPRPAAQRDGPGEAELEELWDGVSGALSAIFQGRQHVPTDIAPFDAASQVEVDQQRADAMVRIQDSMRENRPGEAVALIRAARDVWPEGGQFGSADITPEEEFMSLREIFFTSIPRPRTEEEAPEEVPDEANEEDEFEEEDDVQYDNKELTFNFQDFVTRFAQPAVVKSYITLLREYKKNTVHTNHCLLRMLHRVAYQCKLPAMLYQASLFTTFQHLMFDPACNAKHFQELRNFAKHIVRSFFETVKKNNKIFVELFFYKSVRDSVEVEEGYGTYSTKKIKGAWTEAEDEELRTLYEEYHNRETMETEGSGQMKDVWTEAEELRTLHEEYHNRETMKTDGDVIEYVMGHMIDQTRTRRAILRQLKWLGIIESSKDLRTKAPSKRKWSEEDIAQLRHLYEKYREMSDPMPLIIEEMTTPRSRQVVLKKMLEEGMITDKKEMRKKKAEKAGAPRRRKRREDYESEGEMETAELAPSGGDSASSGEEEPEPASDSDEEAEHSHDPQYVKDIRKFMRRAIENGHAAGVDWVRSRLQRAADDKEEDDDDDEESVPLVPLTEEQENALESTVFQAMLKRCGIKAPIQGQEQFWRIDGQLLPVELRCRARALEKREEANKKHSAQFEALRNMVKQKQKDKAEGTRRSIYKRPKAAEAEEHRESRDTSLNDSALHHEALLSPTTSARRSRIKRALSSDSDDSDEDDKLVIASPNKPPSAKKARIDQSDDSNQSECGTQLERTAATSQDDDSHQSANSRGQSGNNLPQESGSDEDKENKNTHQLQSFPATMLSRPISDDDSDVDDHIPLKAIVKRKSAVVSDSESD